jgi:very-short-patch-repair endonuclease
MRSVARSLRSRETGVERRLWWRLRSYRAEGAHFRRQAPIGGFVVDFVWLTGRLVIEVDGDQHGWRADEDQVRDAWLRANGYTVLRFWNDDVRRNIDGVMEVIHAEVVRRLEKAGWRSG